MSTTSTTVQEITLVTVPAKDQDAMIAFYESLGLQKRTDIPFGESYRWVEVYPQSGTTGIALAPPPPGGEAGGRDTGIILRSDDIDTTHAEMKARGVDVDAEVSRMGDPIPPMFWFRDPEQNKLLVVQSS